MNPLKFVIKSLLHYATNNLTVAIGVAVSTAVLCGGLIIGDSVRYSLEKNVSYRLGRAEYLVDAGERFLSRDLAADLDSSTGNRVVPILQTSALGIVDGGRLREDEIQVLGINEEFNLLAETDSFYNQLIRDRVIINERLAERLQLKAGDSFLLKIKKSSLIPLNAPFVSDQETSLSVRVHVSAIAGVSEMGRFQLRNSQTSPSSVFINLDFLNELLQMEQKINRILIIPREPTEPEEIKDWISQLWNPVDANLRIRHLPGTDELEVFSERVFIESSIADAFRSSPVDKRFILTYFVNAISKGEKETPYSFVSALEEGLTDNEIIVNRWLAEDLGITSGDSIRLEYFIVGPLRDLKEETVSLQVKSIIPIGGEYGGEDLMPFLPGLSDAGHCRDWEAGIPIELDKIRDKDEDYWNSHGGTPKAFISASLGERLWQNRFGDYTAIRFPAGHMNESGLINLFRTNLRPEQIGIEVSDIRSESRMAASNGVDFSQLFIGLSFFVLISAMLLTAMLFLLSLNPRMPQAGTLSALGFSRSMIRKLFILEGSLVSFFGAATGILLAILYNRFILLLLNRIWHDVVRTSILEIRLEALTLLQGFLISFLLGLIVLFVSIRRRLKNQTADIQRDRPASVRERSSRWALLSGLLAVLLSAGIITWLNITGTSTSGYFIAGGLLLIGFLLLCLHFVNPRKAGPEYLQSVYMLSRRNITRNPRRSFAIIVLFAMGTFIIVATGANRKDLSGGADDLSSGTGGFGYFAEATIPVLHNLNDPVVTGQYGLEGSYDFVQFRMSQGDDASCLNLNRVSNPAILGVNPELLDGRFSFVNRTGDLDENHPWLSLQKSLPGDVIPAIADQTVIQWGLGLQVGDTLMYKNPAGDTLRLKLVGGLAASVFQGYVIISNQHFLSHFPTSSGSEVFLINSSEETGSGAGDELMRIFRDFGWRMNKASDRLAEFYSVENTYLSIFLMLGVLSLLLGTIGLGIVLARSIMERKSEIGLLQAIGFSSQHINSIIFLEYMVLLVAGIFSGFFAAVVATLPSLLSVNTDVSLTNLAVILGLLLINAFIWIGLFTRFTVGRNLIAHLRYE